MFSWTWKTSSLIKYSSFMSDLFPYYYFVSPVRIYCFLQAAFRSLLSVHKTLACLWHLYVSFDVRRWFDRHNIDIFLTLDKSLLVLWANVSCAVFPVNDRFSLFVLVCRRMLHWCMMLCTWWPLLCSSLSRSLSAHYSATDTSPGVLETASWPSSKR